MDAQRKQTGMAIIEILLIVSVLILVSVLIWFGIRAIMQPANHTAPAAQTPGTASPTPGQAPQGQPQTPTQQPAPAVGNPAATQDSLKAERVAGIRDNLKGYQLAFGDYPSADPDGWRGFMGTLRSTESVTDPHTGTPYAFTGNNPEFGQIQYRYPASCNEDGSNFTIPKNDDSYAFRLKYSDGTRCTDSA